MSPIKRLVQRCLNAPAGRFVHVIHESPADDRTDNEVRLSVPRFSICLRGIARYQIQRRAGNAELRLRPGDAVFVAPGARLESHPEAAYLSLGVVFDPKHTRFLVAHKRPATPEAGLRHRFVAVQHAYSVLDPLGNSLCATLCRAGNRAPDSPALRLLFQALLTLACEKLTEPDAVRQLGKAHATWEAAVGLLHDHQGSFPGRVELARLMRLHPNHLSRLFTRFTGRSYQHYLQTLRLNRARELLRRPGANVGEVACACGFSDAGYFTRCYRRAYGTAPSQDMPPAR